MHITHSVIMLFIGVMVKFQCFMYNKTYFNARSMLGVNLHYGRVTSLFACGAHEDCHIGKVVAVVVHKRM